MGQTELAQFQEAFCDYLRAPQLGARPPGTANRGMKAYRELLFNNVESFLLACFPVSRRLLGARQWRRTIRAFFADHGSTSPYFRDIPGEFLSWLPACSLDLPPWLGDLAHWEWVELAVAIAPDTPWPSAPASPNPTLRLAHYGWPCHQLAPRRPKHPRATWLGACRDDQGQVNFCELTPSTHALLTLLQTGLGLEQTLARLSLQLGTDQATLNAFAEPILQQLAADGFIRSPTG